MIITILAAILGAIATDIAGQPVWLGAILGGSVGAILTLLKRVTKLESRLDFLQKALAKDWEERQAAQRAQAAPEQAGKAEVAEEPPVVESKPQAETIESAIEQPAEAPLISEQVAPFEAPEDARHPADEIAERPESRITQWVKDYFTSGNIFVRIGVLVLFFGVAFLLKYATDNNMLPIEYRLTGAGLGGIALLITGWRLRLTRETYGLLLQGAGVGILYMVVYGAFQLYGLISPFAAFTLMVAIALFSVVLAVRQNAQSFAVFAVTGGFLAPILASTGKGNYLVLFSYYLILDIVILLVSRYRSWRLLNLVGFAFTFIIATAWGVLQYSSTKFFFSEFFLLSFFLIYVTVAILYAGKGTLKIRKPLDATLLLANPLATFALQAGLVYQYEYGLAFSALGFGVFYLLLARLLWNKGGEGTRLLTEVFVALGVVFASLAIPFALDPQISAAAWAVEGAGVLWIATRQGQVYAKYFALVLLAGASLLFLSDAQTGLYGGSNLFSTFILGTSLIGLAWLFSGWLLREHAQDASRQPWEVTVSKLLLAGGLFWWLGGALLRLFAFLPDLDAANSWLLYLSASTALLFLVSQRCDWREGCLASLVQLPGLLLMLAWFLSHEAHPLVSWGALAWPVGVATLYWLMKRLGTSEVEEGLHPILHVIAFYLVLFLLLWEGRYQLTRHFADDSAWVIAWYVVPVVAGLRFILHWTRWPVTIAGQAYERMIPLSLTALFALWAFASSLNPGDALPLPYIPLLNPIDIMLLAGGFTALGWLMRQQAGGHLSEETRTPLGYLLLGVGFIWINVTLLRVMHHWFGHAWDLDSLLASSQVQMALSILWSVIGVSMMAIASRIKVRVIWLAAAGLLVAVVVKLFLVDLAATGTIARIVSFIIVGGLLILVGYLSPLPPKNEEQPAITGEKEQ